MIKSGELLGRILGPLLKAGLLLIKNVIKALAKSVLIPLRLTVAASAVDAGIHKKILGSGKRPLDLALQNNATLIISNDEMKDIIGMVKSLEDFDLLLKRVSKTTQNETNKQKRGFLSMLLDTLGASLLGNILTGKGAIDKSVSEATKSKSQGR